MTSKNCLRIVIAFFVLYLMTEANAISKDDKTKKEAASKEAGMITSYKDGDEVSTPENLKGTCNNVADYRYLWIVVRPQVAPNYHPQSDQPNNAAISKGCKGEWSGIAYIGAAVDTNINEQFDIMLVSVNAEDSLKFQNYINRANQIGKYPGFSKLPESANVLHKITVIKK